MCNEVAHCCHNFIIYISDYPLSVKHKVIEVLKADDYLHIHVIPGGNRNLLDKRYKVSGKVMEETWREMLVDQSKYVIITPFGMSLLCHF